MLSECRSARFLGTNSPMIKERYVITENTTTYASQSATPCPVGSGSPRTGVGPGYEAHGGDADLHRRQETAWVGGERKCTVGASAALLSESPQARSPRRNDSKFGKRKEPIEGDENQHNGNFKHGHEAGSFAPGPLLSFSWGRLRIRAGETIGSPTQTLP